MLSLAFWIMFVPAVSLLLTVGFVTVKLCDRLERVESRLDTQDLIDELSLFAELGPAPHDDDDLRRKQFDALLALTETRH